MPGKEYTPLQVAWINFVKSLQNIMKPLPEERAMDQYLAFRDKVLEIVLDESFLNDLNTGETHPEPLIDPRIAEALLMELRAFPLALEVAKETTEEKDKGFWAGAKKWLGRGSTVAGSVKDIYDKGLPAFAKGGITLFREALDLFKK